MSVYCCLFVLRYGCTLFRQTSILAAKVEHTSVNIFKPFSSVSVSPPLILSNLGSTPTWKALENVSFWRSFSLLSRLVELLGKGESFQQGNLLTETARGQLKSGWTFKRDKTRQIHSVSWNWKRFSAGMWSTWFCSFHASLQHTGVGATPSTPPFTFEREIREASRWGSKIRISALTSGTGGLLTTKIFKWKKNLSFSRLVSHFGSFSSVVAFGFSSVYTRGCIRSTCGCSALPLWLALIRD